MTACSVAPGRMCSSVALALISPHISIRMRGVVVDLHNGVGPRWSCRGRYLSW